MAKQNARRKKKSNRYAPASHAVTRPLFGVVWLMLGLLAGLVIAALFYLKQQHSVSFNGTKSHVANNAHPIQKYPPQFDFYHILPESKKELAVAAVNDKQPKVSLQAPEIKTIPPVAPVESVADEAAIASPAPSEVEEKRYMVQIASVRNYNDADKLKAQLSLMGFDVSIQKIASGDIILNRVVIGPYDSLVAAQEQQKKLRENYISSIVVKLTS